MAGHQLRWYLDPLKRAAVHRAIEDAEDMLHGLSDEIDVWDQFDRLDGEQQERLIRSGIEAILFGATRDPGAKSRDPSGPYRWRVARLGHAVAEIGRNLAPVDRSLG